MVKQAVQESSQLSQQSVQDQYWSSDSTYDAQPSRADAVVDAAAANLLAMSQPVIDSDSQSNTLRHGSQVCSELCSCKAFKLCTHLETQQEDWRGSSCSMFSNHLRVLAELLCSAD